MNLVSALKKCYKQRISVRTVLHIYGVTQEENARKPFCTLSNEQVTAQILNWIMWHVKSVEQVDVRMVDKNKQTAYTITLENIANYGMRVQKVKHAPELFGKLLYHWNTEITYRRLSVKK